MSVEDVFRGLTDTLRDNMEALGDLKRAVECLTDAVQHPGQIRDQWGQLQPASVPEGTEAKCPHCGLRMPCLFKHAEGRDIDAAILAHCEAILDLLKKEEQ